MAIPNLYQSFRETLSEKDWNKHFWPFLIYTSLSGKNCWKKFGTTIFGHSKFIPVFLGKIVGKNSEWPFLAIPNLYQSSWEKLLENNMEWPFFPFQIYTSPFGKNCQKKIGTSIFCHSWFIPVLLRKIVRTKLEQPFLAIANLYQSFWEKLLEKIQNDHIWPFLIYTSPFGKKIVWKYWNSHFWPFQIYAIHFGKNCQKIIGMAIFGHSEFVPVFLGKIVRKKLEQPYLAIPNLYQSFRENLLKKFRMAIPNLYQSFWETLSEKDWNKHFWPFLIYTSLSGENCWKKFGTSIFGHSKLIPVFLGKIVRKRLEQAFFAIPDLYQFFWEKFSEKNWNNHFGHS